MPADAFFCLSFFLDVPSNGVPGRGGSWQGQQNASRTHISRWCDLALARGVLQEPLRGSNAVDAVHHTGSIVCSEQQRGRQRDWAAGAALTSRPFTPPLLFLSCFPLDETSLFSSIRASSAFLRACSVSSAASCNSALQIPLPHATAPCK